MEIDLYNDCIVRVRSVQQRNLYGLIQIEPVGPDTGWIPAPNWEFQKRFRSMPPAAQAPAMDCAP